jgi:hypothetical protein
MYHPLNMYQMYIQNKCRFGFYVHKNSWHPIKYAKVTAIEGVVDGKMPEGKPPYFGGLFNLPGHPRAGKIMGPRIVTLEADWMDEGKMTVNGGTFTFTQVSPNYPTYTNQEIINCMNKLTI